MSAARPDGILQQRKRRAHEGDVGRTAELGQGVRAPENIPQKHVGAVGHVAAFEVALQVQLVRVGALDEDAPRRAAAQRLDPDGPDSGEEIEHRRAVHGVAEDVEDRLARHLRRGADFFAARAVEPRAARRACDDAHYRSTRFLKYSSVGTSPSRIA